MVRRSKEDSLITRQQILKTAEHAFHEYGVAGTTLIKIAQNAGMTRGAIYWHFSDKRQLFDSLFEDLAPPLNELAYLAVNRSLTDPLGDFKSVIERHIYWIYTDRRAQMLYDIVLNKCEHPSQLSSSSIYRQYFLEHKRSEITATLRNAVLIGQLPQELDVSAASEALQDFVTGHISCWLKRGAGNGTLDDAKRFSCIIVDLLFSPALTKINQICSMDEFGPSNESTI